MGKVIDLKTKSTLHDDEKPKEAVPVSQQLRELADLLEAAEGRGALQIGQFILLLPDLEPDAPHVVMAHGMDPPRANHLLNYVFSHQQLFKGSTGPRYAVFE